MKRIISLSLVCIMTVCLLSLSVLAAKSSGTLSGPDTVRAGDTITLTFKVNGTGILGVSGTLKYDASKLTLTGTSQKIASPWMVEFNGNNFVAYDNDLENPINSNTSLFTATFRVESGLAAGTNISVSVEDLATTDGSVDTNVGTVSYTQSITAPKSTDNTLKSLTVSNATLNPAFDPSVTDYTVSVPFEVSKLDLSYKTNDSKATVSVNNPTLKVDGTTKVTVRVTSESGSTRIYTIMVSRAQDPNYKPSSNNKLSGITVNGFLLSPVFSSDNTEYVVWLPYEVTEVTVKGTASDSKAHVRVEGGDDLVAGQDNAIRVICTAENGDEKVYTILAKRAAAHGGEATPNAEKYTVFWVVDGNVTSEVYEEGSVPVFKGSTEKAADTYYSYTFAGWHQEIVPVTRDMTYVATYTVTVIQQPEDPGEDPDVKPSKPTDPTTPTAPAETQPPATKPDSNEPEKTTGVPLMLVAILSVMCAAAGLAIGILVGKKR